MNYCKGWDDMKYDERKERMISLLDAHETLSIQQLVELLGISPATVRRDVVRMEEEGEIERYWGGIKRRLTPENMRKNTLQSKISDTSYAALGQYAAEQLSDNELIFIGSGTTTLAMIPYIQNRNIHVITNGIPQLEALHRRNIQALLLCGFFKEYSRSLVGKETIEMLRSYRFDRAFLGANGIDEHLRLLSADEYEDSIKNLCIRHSKSTYLLIGKEKFHRTAYYGVPNEVAKDVTIITNYPEVSPERWKKSGEVYAAKIASLL